MYGPKRTPFAKVTETASLRLPSEVAPHTGPAAWLLMKTLSAGISGCHTLPHMAAAFHEVRLYAVPDMIVVSVAVIEKPVDCPVLIAVCCSLGSLREMAWATVI